MKQPNIRDVRDVIESAKSITCTYKTPWGLHETVPARPLGFNSIGNRLRATWLVFTGRADAVTYPNQ